MIPLAGVSMAQPVPLGWAGVPGLSSPPGLNGRGSKLRGSSAVVAPSARCSVVSVERAGLAGPPSPAPPAGSALTSAP